MTAKRADVMDSPEGAHSSQWQQYPEWLRDRLEWFQDLKFGLFMHWGPYSQWGCIESWPLVPDDTWARPDDLGAVPSAPAGQLRLGNTASAGG